MNETEKLFLQQVSEAIDQYDSEKLADAVSDFSSFCFKETAPVSEISLFSEEFIRELMKLIASNRFLQMEDSFKLLIMFQNDWGRLQPHQQLELCQVLLVIYEKLKDPTSQLVIVELFGEYLANDFSLQALNDLSVSKDEVARAYVAHGYKTLVLNAARHDLKNKAKARLISMEKDPSNIVKEEVAAALRDISRKDIDHSRSHR